MKSPQALRRMGVGHILPIEEPLVAEGEGQSSTQVEPSPTQDPHTSEEQSEGPQPSEQDQPQDGGEPPSDAQGRFLPSEQVQDQEQPQDQEQAQDGTQDDQVNPPPSTSEEELERRAVKIASKLTTKVISWRMWLEA